MRERKVLLFPTAMLLAVFMPAAPVHAHAVGKVQLYPNAFSVEHGTDGWHLHLTLVDRDSGSPQGGFRVAASGVDQDGGWFGPVTLKPLIDGRYEGVVSNVAPGRWTITIQANAVPGTEDAVLFTQSYEVHLEDLGTHDEMARIQSGPGPIAGNPGRTVANRLSSWDFIQFGEEWL